MAGKSLLLILPLFFEAILLFSSGAAGTPAGAKLVCYAEMWAAERSSPANYDFVENLPPDTCDYLILLFLTLDGDTSTLRMHTGYGEVDPSVIRDAVEYRDKNPEMKVLMAVGGWEDGAAKYSEMMSESSSRTAFVRSVISTLDTYNLDGLELHWIYPGAAWRGAKAGDRDNLLQLVKELHTAFKDKKWILTASVPPDETQLNAGYNVPRLNSYLHQIHVRNMDMRGDWNGVASGHSPLYSDSWEKPEFKHLNMNDSLSLWVRKGASPRKLFATIPFYGRSFTLRDKNKNEPGSRTVGPGKASPYVLAAGLAAYFEICDDLQNDRLIEKYQNGAEEPYAYKDDYWVGYENEVSIQKKVKVIEQKGLGGMAVFALGLDDFTGKCGQRHLLLEKTKEFLRESVLDPRNNG